MPPDPTRPSAPPPQPPSPQELPLLREQILTQVRAGHLPAAEGRAQVASLVAFRADGEWRVHPDTGVLHRRDDTGVLRPADPDRWQDEATAALFTPHQPVPDLLAASVEVPGRDDLTLGRSTAVVPPGGGVPDPATAPGLRNAGDLASAALLRLEARPGPVGPAAGTPPRGRRRWLLVAGGAFLVLLTVAGVLAGGRQPTGPGPVTTSTTTEVGADDEAAAALDRVRAAAVATETAGSTLLRVEVHDRSERLSLEVAHRGPWRAGGDFRTRFTFGGEGTRWADQVGAVVEQVPSGWYVQGGPYAATVAATGSTWVVLPAAARFVELPDPARWSPVAISGFDAVTSVAEAAPGPLEGVGGVMAEKLTVSGELPPSVRAWFEGLGVEYTSEFWDGFVWVDERGRLVRAEMVVGDGDASVRVRWAWNRIGEDPELPVLPVAPWRADPGNRTVPVEEREPASVTTTTVPSTTTAPEVPTTTVGDIGGL